MSLWFGSLLIPGTHGPVVCPSPELGRRSVYHWGTQGETEIIGGVSGRTLTVEMVLHNAFATTTQLTIALQSLDTYVGKHDRLRDIGPSLRQWDYCTFMGYEPVPLAGQHTAGMLFDSAGCLDGGWWINIRLTFRQLFPWGF